MIRHICSLENNRPDAFSRKSGNRRRSLQSGGSPVTYCLVQWNLLHISVFVRQRQDHEASFRYRNNTKQSSPSTVSREILCLCDMVKSKNSPKAPDATRVIARPMVFIAFDVVSLLTTLRVPVQHRQQLKYFVDKPRISSLGIARGAGWMTPTFEVCPLCDASLKVSRKCTEPNLFSQKIQTGNLPQASNVFFPICPEEIHLTARGGFSSQLRVRLITWGLGLQISPE